MKISASLFSSQAPLAQNLLALSDTYVHSLHIDVFEDLSVLTPLFELSLESNALLDFHFVGSDIDKSREIVLNFPDVYRVCFQYEGLKDTLKKKPQASYLQGLGVQIQNENIFDIIRAHQDFDYFLLMMTNAGISGGTFEADNFTKLRLIKEQFPNVNFLIDGGVNDEVVYILRILGFDEVVIGSYLMKGSIQEALNRLLRSQVSGNFTVSSYLTPKEKCPRVSPDDNLSEIIKQIDLAQIGMTMVVDKDENLLGIISNPEIRKAIIQQEDIKSIKAKDILNPKPIWIYDDIYTDELVKKLKLYEKSIFVLPILNKNHKFVGLINFHNLLKYK
ncbi:MAG: CBS domain-containing protein [Chitinophagales bacterium]|jgi:pentose-5-phosphate-3-epimerase|nr:CBS domain-containing protein [Chitinophagales bacterium]